MSWSRRTGEGRFRGEEESIVETIRTTKGTDGTGFESKDFSDLGSSGVERVQSQGREQVSTVSTWTLIVHRGFV